MSCISSSLDVSGAPAVKTVVRRSDLNKDALAMVGFPIALCSQVRSGHTTDRSASLVERNHKDLMLSVTSVAELDSRSLVPTRLHDQPADSLLGWFSLHHSVEMTFTWTPPNKKGPARRYGIASVLVLNVTTMSQSRRGLVNAIASLVLGYGHRAIFHATVTALTCHETASA